MRQLFRNPQSAICNPQLLRSVGRHVAVACAVMFAASSLHAAGPLALMREAQQAYQQGAYQQALEGYEKAREEIEADLSVLYNVGLCQMRLGRGDEAAQTFENVAAQAQPQGQLRPDSLFNVAVLRAASARAALQRLLHPTASQPASAPAAAQTQPAADVAALHVEDLEAIAADLLGAIGFFRDAGSAGAGADDVEHNLRVIRAVRREVLGLIRQARAAQAEKEKEDALEDPQAFLATLLAEQQLQAAASRRMVRHPAATPNLDRRKRRIALRLQRTTMDRTATLIAHLEQFTETAADPAAASQPAELSPREQVYRAAAQRLAPAIEYQRDACAFLLDGEVEATHEQQRDALTVLREAEALFPIDPMPALGRWLTRLRELTAFVEATASRADWLGDPLLPPAASAPATAPATLEPDDVPLYDLQDEIGRGIARLTAQAQAIGAQAQATTSAPAQPSGEPADPRMDPALNQQLAEVLAAAVPPQTRALNAILAADQGAAASAQGELGDVLVRALDLFPKSIEQRLRALIARQAQHNVAVAAAGGDDQGGDDQAAKPTWRVLADTLAAKLKALLTSPEKLAEGLAATQDRIEGDTRQVESDLKERATAAAGQGGAGAQDPQVQAFIQAGRHVEEADRHMLEAVEEIKRAAVESALDRLAKDGPVQTAQRVALEELVKALEALNPDQQQDQQDPQQNNQDQKEQQQQQPQPRQDIRRAMERLDREREKAERQINRKRRPTVIKDW